ncbi:hypothetical protein L195_g040046 [Trifolium pratense]|uniref:Retrotransposon gag domain-containing protein n=1 Tax=Trifolium pratense TaxID=57577 RepID=A0A2K3LZM4_TRIPR|nr:hypothetical protein L195_g040046 [Trifolium pratense]
MAGEDSTRNVMGNYLKVIDPEEVTEGFQLVNPATLEVTKMVMKELKRDQFKGDDSQDPWEHLINFKETCALQKRTGKDLEEKFLEKYFTKNQYDERKAELLEFKQERKESLSQSIERFKLLKRRCPNHRIYANAELMCIFINGIKQKQRMFLDASAGGSVLQKTPVEVEELVQNMCQNQYNKIGDDEEDLVEQPEVLQKKEQHKGIKRLQEENTESKEETTQATKLEVMMIQLTIAMGEHMTSSKKRNATFD